MSFTYAFALYQSPTPTGMFMPHLAYESRWLPPIPLEYRGLFYTRAQQGKVAELRQELQSSGGKKDKLYASKKIALKKIVANMTMSNNDMVALFPDIVGCMTIPSLEIKKMSVQRARWMCISLG